EISWASSALRPRRTERVEAEAADHDDEPPPDVVDAVDVGGDQSGETFLHEVLGVADVAHDPEGEVDQQRAVLLPDLFEAGVALGAPRCSSAIHRFDSLRGVYRSEGRMEARECDIPTELGVLPAPMTTTKEP